MDPAEDILPLLRAEDAIALKYITALAKQANWTPNVPVKLDDFEARAGAPLEVRVIRQRLAAKIYIKFEYSSPSAYSLTELGEAWMRSQLQQAGSPLPGTSPPVLPTGVTNHYHGDFVAGNKAEASLGGKIKQVTKSHDGDATVQTKVSFRLRLRKLFGLG